MASNKDVQTDNNIHAAVIRRVRRVRRRNLESVMGIVLFRSVLMYSAWGRLEFLRERTNSPGYFCTMRSNFLALGISALLLTMVFTTEAKAQRFSVILSGQVTELFSGDPVKSSLVRVLKAGQEDQQQITRGDGRYKFELERGWKYEVWFSKKNMVTKHVVIDTREIPAYPDVPFYEMELQMTLFPWLADVDLSAFDEALGLAAFKASVRNMSWDMPYTTEMRPVFSKVMDEYEKTYRGYYKRRDRREREVYR